MRTDIILLLMMLFVIAVVLWKHNPIEAFLTMQPQDTSSGDDTNISGLAYLVYNDPWGHSPPTYH